MALETQNRVISGRMCLLLRYAVQKVAVYRIGCRGQIRYSEWLGRYCFPNDSFGFQHCETRKEVHMLGGHLVGVRGEIWGECSSRRFPSGRDQRLVVEQSQLSLVNRIAVKNNRCFHYVMMMM
jgi:hypothetical protein